MPGTTTFTALVSAIQTVNHRLAALVRRTANTSHTHSGGHHLP